MLKKLSGAHSCLGSEDGSNSKWDRSLESSWNTMVQDTHDQSFKNLGTTNEYMY